MLEIFNNFFFLAENLTKERTLRAHVVTQIRNHQGFWYDFFWVWKLHLQSPKNLEDSTARTSLLIGKLSSSSIEDFNTTAKTNTDMHREN